MNDARAEFAGRMKGEGDRIGDPRTLTIVP
jgi:hypothetical protein